MKHRIMNHVSAASARVLASLALLATIVTGAGLLAPATARADATSDRAVSWALAQQGSHKWDWYCLAFTSDAYQKAGVSPTRYYSARTAAATLNAAANLGRPAPKGAFVFYRYGAYDHVGISLGDGRIVHDFGSKGVVVTSENIGLAKIGWAVPRTSPQVSLGSSSVDTRATQLDVYPGAAGFSTGGPAAYLHSAAGYGAHGRSIWTYVNGWAVSNWATWSLDLNRVRGTGVYRLYAFVPRNFATARNARYQISHAGGTSVVSVNQNNLYDAWASLGTYRLNNGSAKVTLTDATGERYVNSGSPRVNFDTIRIVWVSN